MVDFILFFSAIKADKKFFSDEQKEVKDEK